MAKRDIEAQMKKSVMMTDNFIASQIQKMSTLGGTSFGVSIWTHTEVATAWGMLLAQMIN